MASYFVGVFKELNADFTAVGYLLKLGCTPVRLYVAYRPAATVRAAAAEIAFVAAEVDFDAADVLDEPDDPDDLDEPEELVWWLAL